MTISYINSFFNSKKPPAKSVALQRRVKPAVTGSHCNGMKRSGTQPPLLRQLRDELVDSSSGKLIMCEILTAIMISREIEECATWEAAEKQILSIHDFEAVFAQLRTRLVEIDIDFIHHIGYLYLNILFQALLRRFQIEIAESANETV